jgi:hypothetical protein
MQLSRPILLAIAPAEILGHTDRARHALEDFHAAVPGVRSISAIRKWIYPTDALADFEPFYVAGRHKRLVSLRNISGGAS